MKNNSNNNPNKKQPKKIFGVIILFLLIGLIGTSFQSVKMEELAVVLRFGSVHRILDPGLHFTLPYPIEQVIKVDSSSLRRIDSAENNNTVLVLTGDENIANVHFYTLWNVKNPVDFLFSAKSPQATVKAAADSIMREIIAQNNFDKILTVSREEIAKAAHKQLQQFVDKCRLGVQIVEVQLGTVDPPSAKVYMSEGADEKEECVIDSYREVQKAKADFERSRNDAESYENYIIPASRGEAEKILQKAYAYKNRVVKEAEGDADRFENIVNASNGNAQLIKARLAKEYTQTVLSNAKQIIIGDVKNQTPLVGINANFSGLVASDNSANSKNNKA